MYTINDIAKLLSNEANTLLTRNNNELFTVFEPKAVQIITNKVRINTSNPPAWVMMPFVWILEYLIYPKYSGLTEERSKVIRERYNEAIHTLENAPDQAYSGSKVAYYNNMYEG